MKSRKIPGDGSERSERVLDNLGVVKELMGAVLVLAPGPPLILTQICTLHSFSFCFSESPGPFILHLAPNPLLHVSQIFSNPEGLLGFTEWLPPCPEPL